MYEVERGNYVRKEMKIKPLTPTDMSMYASS